jgi:hypothetical protein
MADGLYKVLAYLRDFAKILDNQPPPRAILVTWNGLKHFDPNEDIGLVTANQMTSQMRPFVQAAYQAIAWGALLAAIRHADRRLRRVPITLRRAHELSFGLSVC